MQNTRVERQAKYSFKNQLKRANFPVTMTEFLAVVKDCYPVADSFSIFYLDDENEMIGISSQFDLDEAHKFANGYKKTVKMFIYEHLNETMIPEEYDLNNGFISKKGDLKKEESTLETIKQKCTSFIEPIRKNVSKFIDSSVQSSKENPEIKCILQKLEEYFQEASNHGKKALAYLNKEKNNALEKLEDKSSHVINFINEKGKDLYQDINKLGEYFYFGEKSVDVDINATEPDPLNDIEVFPVEIPSEKLSEEKACEPVVAEEKPMELEEEVMITPYHRLVFREMKSQYDFSQFKDEQVIRAIAKADGNPENAFLFLFSD